jgi:lysophospholipase L1-like esterase
MWSFPAAYKSLFVQRGVGGRTAVQAASHFQKELSVYRPQVVVVQLGINDLRVLPFFPEQRDEIVANTKAALEQIVRQAQAAGANVVLTTIFPLGRDKAGEARPFWHAAPVIPAVNEVNDFIHSLAGKGVQVFDAAAVLAGADGYVQPPYVQDYLHLSPAGYERLNAELLPWLLPAVSL